ncbi:uncharacterized protein [Antedon mediterranea]|uniref:uncharacterized protein n=1 Tax=Antedon mediterranea TaxID=105859 RepID=UPI003AF5C4AC
MPKIDCGSEITLDDVHKLKSKINDTDFLNATNILICETPQWVLRNAEIHIAFDPPYSLCAGNMDNKLSLYRCKDGSIKTNSTGNKAVDCGSEITLQHLQSLKSATHIEDKDLFAATRRLICETPTSVLKNAKIEIPTDDSTYSLYAGKKTHEFVVFREEDGSIKTKKKAINKVQEIHCGTEITLGDVQSLYLETNDTNEGFIRVTQKLVFKAPAWIRKDANIELASDPPYSFV